MVGIDDGALRAAADAYAAAREECRVAEVATNAAYERLDANPESLEFQIDCDEARKREAAAALRTRRAKRAYIEAGGYEDDDAIDDADESCSSPRTC